MRFLVIGNNTYVLYTAGGEEIKELKNLDQIWNIRAESEMCCLSINKMTRQQT